MITKATSPGYLYAVTTDSTCIITDVATRYNLCKAIANKQGMFAAIGGSVECSDDNVVLTQASTTSGGTRFEVVVTRPEIGEAGVIYLVPSSNSATENLYEEWLWVDDKWEQIGSAGLNLSNYAQLTTANTFSADNTFNGNLIKKTSTIALADNSVLNRSEMDSRYGLKGAANTWTGVNTFNAATTFEDKVDAANIESNFVTIKGKEVNLEVVSAIGMLSQAINMHASSSVSVKSGNVDIIASGIYTLQGHETYIKGSYMLSLAAPTIAIRATDNSDVKVSVMGSLTTKSLHVKEVNSNLLLAPGKKFTFNGVEFDDLTNLYYAYLDPNGIRYHAGRGASPDTPPAQFDTRGVKTCMLPVEKFGADKWGIKIDHTGCQLFGIDFNYGDVWSETNDKIKAQGATPVPGLDSANYIDTVKIRKPAVSIETTGIGSLSFDYATEAYIRTFPNDGGQGIFEFQAGNWTDSEADWIKRGPVDLRKASATTLVPTSVLNMEEGDARWGGSEVVLVDRKIPDWMVTPQTELIAVSDVGPGGAFGVAVGPGVTANVYNDMAIGGWLDTSPGLGGNTLLGYGFKVIPNAKRAVAIGYAETNSAIHNSAIVIGNECTARGKNIIAIGGDVSGNFGIALNGTAQLQSIALGSVAEQKAIAIGYGSTAARFGTALGNYSVAGINEFVMQTNGDPSISMQLYGGTDWESHDTTGYLKFVAAPSSVEIKHMSSTEREEITIYKKPLWDAIQRANDYNYPAQPFVSLADTASEVSSTLANAQPNTIYHIVVGTSDIDLTDMMFNNSIPGIASAELHFEIPSGTAPSVIWPDIMIWPDEADPTAAPALTGSDTANKLYAIVVRKQITRAGEFLVASVAYSFEY